MCPPCPRTCVHHVSGPYRRTKKEPKSPRPIVRPSLRSGSLAPALLRGPAATGHPWPIAALPASMPVDPLLRTSSRPPGRAGRSKALRRGGRPAGLFGSHLLRNPLSSLPKEQGCDFEREYRLCTQCISYKNAIKQASTASPAHPANHTHHAAIAPKQ